MPSRLADLGSKLAQRVRFAQTQAYAQRKLIVPVKTPWAGYTPDIPYDKMSLSACVACENLIVRISPSGVGEVITISPGYGQIDTADLPLGAAVVGVPPGAAITHLTQIERTNSAGARTGEFDISPIAITAGDGTTANSSKFYRISPVSTQWTAIAFTAKGGTTGPIGNREAMPHSTQFPAGAVARAVTATQTGPIAEPVLLWCNNIDEVEVFPAGTGLHTFEPLTSSALNPFIARSVESFDSRVVFLNTSEAYVRHRQRVRWSPVGTCDPDPAQPGSGAIDFREFHQDGLRLEAMNDVLGVYFADGMAFLQPTGNLTAPMSRQILTDQRGLLGTHALTTIGSNTHFGIFTDGWWFLDSSGRWTEAGITQIDGVPVNKWRRTFYQNLDINHRHRLHVYYESPTNMIKIAYPRTTDTDVQEVWNYEINSDRVWIDRYPVTCWGSFDRQISQPLLWSGAGTLTWSTIVGSWASLEAQFGVRAVVHGDLLGYVFQHDNDLISRDNASTPVTTGTPDYLYQSPFKESPDGSRYLLTCDRVLMDYVNANSPNATFTALSSTGNESGAVGINVGAAGSFQTAHRHFRLTDQNLGFKVNGTAPVIIRGFSVDAFNELAHVRR